MEVGSDRLRKPRRLDPATLLIGSARHEDNHTVDLWPETTRCLVKTRTVEARHAAVRHDELEALAASYTVESMLPRWTACDDEASGGEQARHRSRERVVILHHKCPRSSAGMILHGGAVIVAHGSRRDR
jgi:hypothetical protein